MKRSNEMPKGRSDKSNKSQTLWAGGLFGISLVLLMDFLYVVRNGKSLLHCVLIGIATLTVFFVALLLLPPKKKNLEKPFSTQEKERTYQRGLEKVFGYGSRSDPFKAGEERFFKNVADEISSEYKVTLPMVLLFAGSFGMSLFICFGLRIPNDNLGEQVVWCFGIFLILLTLFLFPTLRLISDLANMDENEDESRNADDESKRP
jgi:hypothetical protein